VGILVNFATCYFVAEVVTDFRVRPTPPSPLSHP
jgi:hypothetical protein